MNELNVVKFSSRGTDSLAFYDPHLSIDRTRDALFQLNCRLCNY